MARNIAQIRSILSASLAAILALCAPHQSLATGSPTPASGQAGEAQVAIAEDTAKWESGYGVRFFQVVGSATNRGDKPLGAVLVHVDLLGDGGEVVAQTDCWNGNAETLAELRDAPARAKLAEAGVKPIPAGGSDKWRCTFLEEDTPKFAKHRVTLGTTLPTP